MKTWGRLIGAVVVLAVLFTWMYWPKKPAALPASSPPLVKINNGDVKQIQIEPATGAAVTLNRSGDNWNLEKPYAAPADTAQVTDLLNDLGGITTADDAGAGANPATFGLDHPAHVILTLANSQLDFQFGGDSPTGGNSYMRVGDSGTIKIVPSFVKQDALVTPFSLENKAILTFPEDKLTGMELVYQGKKVELSRKNGDWPKDQQDNVQSLLDAINSGQMVAMADATGKDAAADGLSNPDTSVTVAWPDGTARLDVGKKKGPTEYYARNSGSPAIFTVSDSLLTNMNTVANPPKPPTVTNPKK